MPILPRTSLASLICPSAPFLAPRLLCSPASLAALTPRCSTQSFRQQRFSYATEARPISNAAGGAPIRFQRDVPKAKKAGKAPVRRQKEDTKAKERRVEKDLQHQSSPLGQLQAACNARDLRQLMSLYPSVVALGPRSISRDDTRKIAQSLHTCIRHTRSTETELNGVFSFVQRIIEDIRTGAIPSHPYANVHLLGIYKESKRYEEGYVFWQWLVQMDETFVSPAVYGAAIELMAYGHVLGLADLESLYLDALKRFPGTFAEYHLSPDAIVPDRSQPTNMADLPVILLQGILTARVLSHDWKNAYMALDTALRLFPAQLPPRMFELFMTERPLQESYTIYLMACRAGLVFKPSHLTTLIKKLQKAMSLSSCLADRMTILSAIVQAIYAYLEAGGTLQPLHVSSFIQAFDSLLPDKDPQEDFLGDEAVLRNIIVTAAHEYVSTIIQAGHPPSAQVFGALIHIAGKLHVPDLMNVSLQDLRTAHVDMGPIGFRTILTSAGYLRNKKLIEEYWTHIASQAKLEGSPIPWEDWITFLRACKHAEHVDFFTQQLSRLEHTMNSTMKTRLTYQTETSKVVPEQGEFTFIKPATLTTKFDTLRKQVKNIAAVVMSGQPLDMRKTPFHMSYDPHKEIMGSREDMRSIYDEYTLDPHQPPPPPRTESEASTPCSPTGIPLNELRFENWVSIVELMHQADIRDIQYLLRLEESEMSHANPQEVTRAFHAETLPFGNEHQLGHPLDLDALRIRIKQLRSPSILSPPIFRKISSDHPDEVIDHVAPDRPLSRRPLGRAKTVYYHALRLQPTPPDNDEQVHIANKKHVQSADLETKSDAVTS